ncbi:MAG TPA: CRISPR-associated helicase Cas3' [Candidatus Kryptonia bacterium]
MIYNNPTVAAFWAKTTREGRPGISVLEHMLNVGFVARAMAQKRQEILSLFRVAPSLVGTLAALHDLGKISPGFQRKCEEWLKLKGLLEIAQRGRWDSEMEGDHGKVSHAALQKIFNEKGMDERSATYLSTVLGGHHGRLNRPNERGFKPQKAIIEDLSGINWEEERKSAAETVVSEFGIRFSDLLVDDSSPALWWLAGLTSVADWIGSDERYFPAEGRIEVTRVPDVAKKCIEEIGLIRPEIVTGLSFLDLFGFKPNEIQSAALSTITNHGVYVIEAPMGTGKTEAALGVAYHLLCDGKASGIYFALPTQATSNRMHLRMKKFVKRIAPDADESKIIHSNSWLLDVRVPLSPARTSGGKEEDAQTGRDWFSSAKRALIAPFGVGTVDQALLGIVAAKHFFVRHFALAGKVVILDEIHSYDLYTGTLIDRLIETLEVLGCTVIVLSATLSKLRRGKIVSAENNHGIPGSKEPYPLITGRRLGEVLEPLSVQPPVPRSVDILFKADAEAMSIAVEKASKGACVLWVSNTVEAAQKAYTQIRQSNSFSFPIGLLHSRFPFWRREELENEWMNRLGKDSSTRCGSILVSTQIVEQSVDLDADLMITGLAPTDMLLQRLGRLWRHDRKDRPISKRQLYIIEEQTNLAELRKIEKKEILKVLGDKALVYDPYVLLRSLEQWKRRKKINIPRDIRKMIEATYKKREKEPISWQELLEDTYGKALALKQKALMSSNIWQVALDDEEGVQTRINELPTLSLILSRSFSETSIKLIDGTVCGFEGDEFELATAQALHRNLVKVPEYHFGSGKRESHPSIERYVRGKYALGLLGSDETISAKQLKSGVTLHWNNDLGLVIEKTKEDK